MAGTLVIYVLLSVVVSLPAITVVLALPILTMLGGFVALLLTFAKQLYKSVPEEQRPCFWVGFATALVFIGAPGVIASARVAWAIWLSSIFSMATIDQDHIMKCLFGMRSLN